MEYAMNADNTAVQTICLADMAAQDHLKQHSAGEYSCKNLLCQMMISLAVCKRT